MTTDSFNGCCQRLAAACAAIDLATAVLRNPAQVKVWEPGLECFAELVSCRAGRDGIYFLWSWGAPICQVGRAGEAAEAIARVVSPSRPHCRTVPDRSRR
ncbi:hypothetical protein GCM10023196_049220 [Actinoallomurus vinaceus]|uniref:Uncharacterized protein n=1 Tax=Actinoallomurus vinaceus TaxID=1080074 RepID=A0ABP8UGD4_9ACTN